MKLYAPQYYNDFICIADQCKNSCCIGWEIDIDDKTYENYRLLDGDFGNRLKNNISTDGNDIHFILTEDEKCPFLNSSGLCDIVTMLGEQSLCQICSDHPRFRNFFDSRTEIGLGLCCEAAGKLILNNKEKIKIVEISDDGEECYISDEDCIFFSVRQHIFDMLTNRELSLEDRIEELLCEYDIVSPQKPISVWADRYIELERLNPEWTKMLELLKTPSPTVIFSNPTVFEQILVYFIYRHLPDSTYDRRFDERILFSILSTYVINVIYSQTEQTLDNLIEIARMYSSEIEYSEKNIDTLLRLLGELE